MYTVELESKGNFQKMELRNYQKAGIDKTLAFLRDRKSAYLADEMGLGKTTQAIHIAKFLGAKKILVVCPASLRLNWRNEFKMWTEQVAFPMLSGRDGMQSTKHDIIVASYDLAAGPAGSCALKSREWDMLILDEAHYLKSKGAKRTKACLHHYWERAEYKLAMSGTPLPNGVIDGFTLFNKMAPEAFPDYYKYGFRYTKAEKNWFTGKWEFRGGRNLPELRAKIKSTFMVRRTKASVLRELPAKVYSQIPVALGKHSHEASADEADIQAIREAIENGKQIAMSTEIATKRRSLGLLKVKHIVDYINTLLSSRDKVVLFLYHKEVISAVAEALGSLCAVISGETPAKKRQDIIDAFQKNDNPRVFIGQIAAAGTGITLTAASICVFGELSWTPAEVAQAIDRLHRIGQKEVVEVHYLIGEGTLDEQIIGSLRGKIADIGEVLKS
jgi:SWI/SNF-related matrix-associated actin-dependent regulator 1 of chromatin subfamily A